MKKYRVIKVRLWGAENDPNREVVIEGPLDGNLFWLETMKKIYPFEEVIDSFDKEYLEEDEHIYDGSGDYLCDICNDPVNTEDWCFTCNSYVYIHHINEK